MTQQNPYAPPRSEVRDHVPIPEAGDLASRWARLGASILDGLVSLILVVPMMFFTGYWQDVMDNNVSVLSTLGVSVATFVLFVILNGYLLATYGQTIGKRLVGIRIVSVADERRPTVFNLLGLRYGSQWVLSAVPIVGSVFSLIDMLFIFRADRRCVHDLIAGTKVINA